MENLYVAATTSSPEVRFDAEQQILELIGESYPENTAEFYRPIMNAVDASLQMLDRPFTLNLEVPYANSSSSKVLMDMLDRLDEASEAGKPVTVNWYYSPGNESALEDGEEYEEDIHHLTFNLLERES